ncbi:heme ABC exporter ATP-binding protein CcmA [Caulobacter sp. KR2-114]|uniref:heme ABC exporter ATP-binding protein CcmA n=1 Tax=Caulobacter sp. KR2-114 TaxID=3400912 RepID=UPI003C0737A8
MIESITISGLALQRGERLLFRDLTASVARGEAVALTGANGAGKTSLLRAVAGFIRPAAGAVRFEGPGGAEIEAADARRTSCHILGHQDGLKSGRTAREELIFQARWAGGDAASALEAARLLGLVRLLDLEVRKLSAGQRRRLALSRLIAAPRPVWLLDEPMAPLDGANRALFGELMAEHLAGGGLVLAAVHDPLPVPARGVEIAPPAMAPA